MDFFNCYKCVTELEGFPLMCKYMITVLLPLCQSSYSLQFMPPVTVMVSPVMYEASSEHRNPITPPISSGSPSLRDQSITYESGYLNQNVRDI